ncbi:GWxTD domain-containing protein [candidate division KSB1 bacterium]|nr:GWxTD domain-containing protein [candidate division KSB1 bacterium]
MSQTLEKKGPSYNIDIANTAVPDNFDMSRLNIYFQIVYDELQFIKIQDGFEANYEVTVIVYDDDEFQVDGKLWKETIYLDDYDKTNSQNDFSFTFTSFDLDPDKYKIMVSVQDLETEKAQGIKFDTKLRDFSKNKVTASDIIFLKGVSYDSLGIKSITPELTNPYKGLTVPAYAYFEIYNPSGEPEAEINYTIRGLNSKFEIKDSYTIPLTGIRTLEAFTIPIDSLKHDIYQLTINIKAGKKVKLEKNFYIRWQGIPFAARDIESAIKQVIYIATPDEWKALDKASDENKLEEFKSFWKRHDPTPGTEVNEAMEAHYGRVEYANQNFSVMQREGWKTDRGMVYIVLGPPDDIVRDPYPSDMRPWQIWNYYRINRRFEFIDYTGFGDYRFYRPYSMYELQLFLR